MSDLPFFLKQLHAALNSRLSEVGFQRGENDTWSRQVGENINVVWLQKHSQKDECCINLGIHYVFLPKLGSNDLPTDNRITQPECEIKLRLTEDTTRSDQWWALSDESIAKISQLMMGRGLAIFTTYQLEGQIRGLEAEDVISSRVDLLKPLTKVRACLLLARIHEHLKEPTKSVRAAKLGLEHAGMAVGPKKEFKEMIKRQETAL